MQTLAVNLFGAFSVQRDEQTIDSFATAKARGLLAYLAVEGTRPLDRSHLAGFLWPEVLDESARGNLRYTLSNVRKTIGDQTAEPPYLQITRRTIQINPDALDADKVVVDVHQFQTLCQQAASDFTAAKAAVSLYRAPFLESALVTDSPEFDTWAQLQRDLLHRQMAELLSGVIARLCADGTYAEAIPYARRYVDHEPWREEAHLQFMNVLWRSGQADAAMRQYEQCRRSLQEELDVAPSPEAIALYEAIRDGAIGDRVVGENKSGVQREVLPESSTQAFVSTDPQPRVEEETISHAAEPARPRHNLPAQVKSFIGREGELTEIDTRFAQEHCRLVTIIGPGGMGKTQLALEYARRAMDSFPDGAWFVPLAGVAEHEQIPSTIIDALGILMTPEQDPQTRLWQYLGEKTLFLILDNFEHLREGALLVSKLLELAPSISILVTSRERLNLQIETVFPLGGLDLPQADHQQRAAGNGQERTTERAQESGAVALFVDCAQRADASFSLSPDARPAVNAICQLIDGMPLGIELAAVWTRLLPCDEILENLRRSIDLLTVSMPDVPARHRSMRALIEESWQDLSAETQRVFARASIFRGNCDWPALQEVAAANMLHVAELVDRGFLRRMSDGSYQIHELMRQFGAEILAQSESTTGEPIEAEVAHSHAHYYLHLLKQMESDLIGSEQIAALQTVSRNIENIRLAWEWALTNHANPLIDLAAEALYRFYSSRGQAHEGETLFAQATARLSTDTNAPVPLFVRIRNYWAFFLEPLGRVQEAQELLTENIAMARQHNLFTELGWALLHFGTIVAWKDVEQARPILEESHQLFQQTEDTEGVIAVLGKLWDFILIRQVDREPALAVAEEALEWARTLDAPLVIARCLARLGTITRIQEQFDQARHYVEEALRLAQHLKNPILEAQLLNNLAVVAYDQRDYHHARTLMEACVACYRKTSLENSTALIVEENLGRLAQRLGEWDVALHHYQETARKSRRANNHFMFARCNEGLAQVWLQRHELQNARQALRMAREVKDYWELPEMRACVLNNLIQILIVEDEYEAAMQLFAYKSSQALAITNAEFDNDAVGETLRRRLGEQQYQRFFQEAQTLDIGQLVDSLL